MDEPKTVFQMHLKTLCGCAKSWLVEKPPLSGTFVVDIGRRRPLVPLEGPIENVVIEPVLRYFELVAIDNNTFYFEEKP